MRSAINVLNLLRNITATTTGAANGIDGNQGCGYTIEAMVSGTGAVSATIDVYGAHSADNTTTGRTPLYTFSLSGTTRHVLQLNLTAPYPYLFVDLTAISGTSATVNCTVAT